MICNPEGGMKNNAFSQYFNLVLLKISGPQVVRNVPGLYVSKSTDPYCG